VLCVEVRRLLLEEEVAVEEIAVDPLRPLDATVGGSRGAYSPVCASKVGASELSMGSIGASSTYERSSSS
jgi:hypothetical protein